MSERDDRLTENPCVLQGARFSPAKTLAVAQRRSKAQRAYSIRVKQPVPLHDTNASKANACVCAEATGKPHDFTTDQSCMQ